MRRLAKRIARLFKVRLKPVNPWEICSDRIKFPYGGGFTIVDAATVFGDQGLMIENNCRKLIEMLNAFDAECGRTPELNVYPSDWVDARYLEDAGFEVLSWRRQW